MAYSITQFQNSVVAQAAALDNNFATFGALVPIPCTISGTNTLTLTQNGVGLVPTPTLSAYTTGMLFTGIASTSNSAGVTVQVGSLPALTVYKDILAGPSPLSGGEIIGLNAVSFLFDAALASGAGGFHLITATSSSRSPQIVQTLQVGNNFLSTLTNLLSGSSPTLTFTATPGWSSQDQTFTLTGTIAQIPAVGDFLQVTPPSLGATGVSYDAMVLSTGSLSSVSSVATINVRLVNSASASVAANSGIYRYLALRAVP
jgi:hypothetical protein